MKGRPGIAEPQELAGFDPHDAAFRSDPFPMLDRMRSECPASWTDAYGGFWAITRYRDVLAVLRDPSNFRSGDGVVIPPLLGAGRMIPMEMDPPRHSDLRKALAHGFSHGTVQKLESFARETVREILDRTIEGTRCDLGTLAAVLPLRIVSSMLGISPHVESFRRWEKAILHRRVTDPEGGREAGESLRRYFEEEIGRRVERSGAEPPEEPDLIDALMSCRLEGRRMSRDELVDACCFLLLAGLDNTAFALWAGFWYLAEHPELQEELRGEPALIPPFGEEILRLYAPVPGLARTSARDAELGGSRIRAGERLYLLWAAADRDPEEFEDPDRFVMHRPNAHLAFGSGIHRCLGAPLVRLELRVGVEEVLGRVPQYRLQDPGTLAFRLGEATALPVTWGHGG